MPRVASDEVAQKAPDCHVWLRDNGLELLEITNKIVQEAMRIKGLLGIVNDNYHPKGVGENDLLIIAAAKVHNLELVSDESTQKRLPDIASKRKIPAVCDMNEVAVKCIDFLTYIKRSGRVFR